jgi:rSAM/selenodomain-associated transferase 1
MRKALLIFIKNPALGKVKTRLAKTVGPHNALKIYQYLLEHTMEITFELDNVDKFLFYNEFIPTKDEWPSHMYQKELQHGNDLGAKMKNAFDKVFDENYSKAVLIMPDCPKMTDTLLDKAFRALDTNDFVLGPTNDGGYYLIGMKNLHPEVFDNKTYGTDHVLDDAINVINSLGKTYFKLPALTDVDMEEDLGKLRKMISPEAR